MDKAYLIQSVIDNPFERLLLRVSTCLLNEPKFYKSAETVVEEIRADLAIIESLEPSFIPKLAFYSRNSLNLRSVSNFLLAWSATKPNTHPALKEFFTSAINLPSDLIDFVQKYQDEIGNPTNLKIPTFLQKLIKKKFADFNVYQLGKYCSEGKRKRELSKKGPGRLTMKKLVRVCHIKKPEILVASVLGKKYPESVDGFLANGFGPAGKYEAEKAGKRMKVPTPYTWETTLAQYGNKAECWEDLMKSNKLPFMAMLRNLRNMLLTGVDFETHNKVIEKLTNPDVIQNSRLFPFQFMSAYNSIEVDLDYLQKIKENPEYVKPEDPDDPAQVRFVRGGRGGRARAIRFGINQSDDDEESGQAPRKKKKVMVPKEVPTAEIITGYKGAIDEAVKLSTSLNIDPIRGNTAIFCDCSGSMDCPVSSKNVTSYNTCRDVGFLFGLMVRSVTESCEVFIFSSSCPPSIPKCWTKVDVQGDNIFELHKQLVEASGALGGGTEFPYDWFEEAIKEKKWIDNFIIFTDMMLSEVTGHDVFARGGRTSYEIITEYREKVNPDMRYVTVDLAGSAKELKGAKYESEFKNLLIGGYSDSILKMISTTGVKQSDLVRESKPIIKKPHS